MSRILLFTVILCLFAACGDDPTPNPEVVPSKPGTVEDPRPFGLETRVGVPGRSAPVRVTGDSRGVVISIRGEDGTERPLTERLAAGNYRVTARREDTVLTAVLSVADLALILKRSPAELFVFVADAASGHPVAGADITVEAGEIRRESRSDADGVLRIDLKSKERARITATRGENFGYGEIEAPAAAGIVTCLLKDRSVGRLGEMVNIAGYYRARNGDYRSMDAREIRLDLVDAHGSVLASEVPDRRAPGFFETGVTIPVDAPAKGLSLRATVDGVVAVTPMPVEWTPPSGFSVRVETDLVIGRTGVAFPFHMMVADVTGEIPGAGRLVYRVERVGIGVLEPVLEGNAVLFPGEPVGAEFRSERPGPYRITATVTDRNGLAESAVRTVLLRSTPTHTVPDEAKDGFLLSVDKKTSEPGQPVRLRLSHPFLFAGAGVLLTSEGGSLGAHSVEELTEGDLTVEFKAPDRPGRWVRFVATAVSERKLLRSEVRIWIRPKDRRLSVSVLPATDAVDIRVSGPDGQPVNGQATVLIVEDVGPAPRIEETFYDGAPFEVITRSALNRVHRAWSVPASLPVETGSIPVPRDTPLQSSPDVALWAPSLKIAEGAARVSFPAPARPRDWRVLVFAESAGHRFGTGLARIPSPLSRFHLAAPAFLVEGDLVTLRTTGAAGRVESPDLLRVDERGGATTFSVPNLETARVTVASTEDPRVQEFAEIRVHSALGPGRSSVAGRISARRTTVKLNVPSGAADKSVSLSILLTHGLRAAILNAPTFPLDTIDGALTHGPSPVALARIYARQAADGTIVDLTTTANVVGALGRWRAAGHDVSEDCLTRAVSSLKTALGSDNAGPSVRALVLDALVDAGQPITNDLSAWFPTEVLEKLPVPDTARLLRVLTVSGRGTEAADLVGVLDGAHRRDEEGRIFWGDGDVQTTAIALRALLSEPEAATDDLVSGAVRFLLDRRDGFGWRGARETLVATVALRALAEQRGEPSAGAISLRIRVNDVLVTATVFDPEEDDANGRLIEVPAKVLVPGRNVIRFEAAENADLDYVARLTWRAEIKETPGTFDRDLIRVRRDGQRLVREPVRSAVRRGDVLLLTARLRGKTGPVAVDLPIPGGTVLLGPKTSLDDALPARANTTIPIRRPDGVRFLVARDGKGEVDLGVLVRVTHSGRFTMRPFTARRIEDGELIGASKAGVLYVE